MDLLSSLFGRKSSTSSSSNVDNSKNKEKVLVIKKKESSSEMTVGRCICCNSELRYPVDVPCFRCTICDTVNDLILPIPLALPESSTDSNSTGTVLPYFATITEPLSLSRLESSIQSARSSQDYKDLEKLLKSTFSSWDILNGSFAKQTKDKKEDESETSAELQKTGTSAKVSLDEPRVNMEDVRVAWHMITLLPKNLISEVLNSIESLLKRPGRKFTDPNDLKFFLILLENPILSHSSNLEETRHHHILTSHLFGLISNLSNELHHYLVNWLSRYPQPLFQDRVEFVNKFITYRLNHGHEFITNVSSDNNTSERDGKKSTSQYLSPQPPGVSTSRNRRPLLFGGSGSSSTSSLDERERDRSNRRSNSHSGVDLLQMLMQGMMSGSHSSSASSIDEEEEDENGYKYSGDWAIAAASRVMALFFAANNINSHLPISVFYNTMVDLKVNLVTDFDNWERRTGKFSFCQYPFLLSMSAKMDLISFEARRQMYNKFREALIVTALMQEKFVTPFITLRIRREALVYDSLSQLSNAELDLKKRLRIEFPGEEGVDAGGLTKEWLLLLVKELFDPKYGMWIVDEDSKLSWFNPSSFDSQEYYLVGVIVGLAVYHSTILDINLPLACYKKLLGLTVGLSDLMELRPAYAQGLQALLDYDKDDVEEVFCRDFVGEYESYGEIVRTPLISNGENIPVTQKNKKEYVDLVVDFVLNKSIHTQFELFKSGFLRVLQGNALSLFRPEEIELLVRGSTDIDIGQIQAITEYEGFSSNDSTVRWFWETVDCFNSEMKKRFLRFVTGTDRIPGTGSAGIKFKISCAGEGDSDYLPVAHTCFNQILLHKYSSREKLESKLRTAILESEGFGIK
ncbi:hypothetical protein BKA69DRAFT_1103846 [Paraphysoderma sedebokerense]|nr:hypothetical protein BKA69DRAFT_1103837 [Paraphysoderma sedebokerense]KAI9136506.1 hypothetical protein BKA69DRAFT_1103846 [Paraphysoderma sedebokerense]